MACPTCDHTMNGLGDRWFWCPRCGTLRDESENFKASRAPALVERCRNFEMTNRGLNWIELWHQLGIEESINLPDARPSNC